MPFTTATGAPLATDPAFAKILDDARCSLVSLIAAYNEVKSMATASSGSSVLAENWQALNRVAGLLAIRMEETRRVIEGFGETERV